MMSIPINLACDRTVLLRPCPPGFECIEINDICTCVPIPDPDPGVGVTVRTVVSNRLYNSSTVVVGLRTVVLENGIVVSDSISQETVTTTAANLLSLRSGGLTFTQNVGLIHDGRPDFYEQKFDQAVFLRDLSNEVQGFFMENAIREVSRSSGECVVVPILQVSSEIVVAAEGSATFQSYYGWDEYLSPLAFPPCNPYTNPPVPQRVTLNAQTVVTVVGVAQNVESGISVLVEKTTEEIVNVSECVLPESDTGIAITTLDTEAGREVLEAAGEEAKNILDQQPGVNPGQSVIISSIEWERQKRLKNTRPGRDIQGCGGL